MTALSGVDVDTDELISELNELVTALENSSAYVQSVEHKETTAVENASTETLTLEYVITQEFDGIDPIQHETRGDE